MATLECAFRLIRALRILPAGAIVSLLVLVSGTVALASIPLQQELIPADGQPGDAFGGLVAVDGSTLAVGAPLKNSSTGVAYVFVRPGGTWSQQAALAASDSVAGDQFGSAVAFASSSNGQSELLVGAQGKN